MKSRNFFVGAALLAAVALMPGCTRHAETPNTPQGALEKYVTSAFEVKSVDDKKKLMELSTGEALEYLQNIPDQTFQRQFINSKLKYMNMKMKDQRQENDGDVSLVYELTFQDGSPDAIHTNKKIAYLHNEGGTWKIKGTKNVKTFLERKEDLVITPETTEPAAKEEGAAKK